MIDIKSILGYSEGSPFAHNPYIDINSNVIDMSNTPIDLIGIDNKGNKKKMKAGRRNPYIFEGSMVREMPLQRGGYNRQDLYKYLFSDDYEDDDYTDVENTAPAEDELPQQVQAEVPQEDEDDYQLAMQLAMQQDEYDVTGGNPYIGGEGSPSTFSRPTSRKTGTNPYTATEMPSNPAKHAYQFFLNEGISKHVAAAMAGNFSKETGNFRADVISDEVKGDKGTSHGLAQWHKGRWTDFLRWADANNMNPKSFNTQLKYAVVEGNQRGDIQRASTAKTVEEATYLFGKYYERCAQCNDKNSPDIQKRIKFAKGLYSD